MSTPIATTDDSQDKTPSVSTVLLVSVALVALCGIVYELLIGTVSSYLLGNSVYQFSITIGFFMFAMGVGSYVSKYLTRNLIQRFVYIELMLSVVGGLSTLVLFLTFPYAPHLYETVMLCLILIIGSLVGLELPLITRIIAEGAGTRNSIANAMSMDYAGALVGAVAFPLFLLPSLGLIRASFAIGLINALVALVNVFYLRDHLVAHRRLAVSCVLTIVVLLALTIAGTRLTAFAEQHLYFDQIVMRADTEYQKIVVTRNWKKEDLRLFIDGYLQFSESDEYRYHEMLVHPVMHLESQAKHILILGGGDGMALREVLKYDSVEHVDLVDIDPAITDLAVKFAPLRRINNNSLEDSRVHVHNKDAFAFVNQAGAPYDRIIIDLPDPHNDALSKLYSREFYRILQKRLRKGGGIVTQSSSPFFARRTYWAIENTLASQFTRTLSYQIPMPSFGVWGFNLATKGDVPVAPEFSIPTRYLTADAFRAAQTFGKDISRVDGLPVNSVFAPSLYQLYLEDLETGPVVGRAL